MCFNYNNPGASREIKDYVLSDEGYREIGTEGFKIKSAVMPTTITVKDVNGKEKKLSLMKSM